MRDREHHIQDACEHLATAMLQSLAESAGRAITQDAAAKYAAFRDECAKNGLKESDFTSGEFKAYKESLELHLPRFFERLVDHFRGERLDFVCDERVKRNQGMKGDFEIRPEYSPIISVSLKNYRGSAERPQFNAQTFNSFALAFLFPKGGKVGAFLDTSTGDIFTGSSRPRRDKALNECGYAHLIKYFHELDALQAEIRDTFLDSDEWEYLDENKFDPIRKRIGLTGATTMQRFLTELPDAVIKDRLLRMAGLDGVEAVLIMDPKVMAESVTDFSPLRRLHEAIRAENCQVRVDQRGQSLFFTLAVGAQELVSVNVPHTINKNGAWLDDPSYGDGKFHPKENVILRHLQRRPKKSRQISTSINTYVDLRKAGIFSVSEGGSDVLA